MSQSPVTADVPLDQDIRSVPVKWVVVVAAELPAGLVANATACVSAVIGKALPHLLGPDTADASGTDHAGLPWSGCTILGTDTAGVAKVRRAAVAASDLFVADMVEQAQRARSYDDYVNQLGAAAEDDLTYLAVGVVGPRKTVGKIVGGLPLLR